ncbi:phage late control D family protein [Streptomyces canus]|uniref:phage late control D family protein n=1 Tax=Streptomyces canus TaxID=58343 RepID=UPI0036B2448D
MTAQATTPSTPPTDRYAPEFSIGPGSRPDPDLHDDVLDLRVTAKLNEAARFDLTVSNWDPERCAFKYEDDGPFALGAPLRIGLGYAGALVTVFSGIVTTVAQRFPDSGPPTLSVGGQDALFRLKDSKPKDSDDKVHRNRTDSEIARRVAQRNHLKAVVSPSDLVHELVIQKNQDDASFLLDRAKRIDFDCFVVPSADDGQDELHFELPADGRGGSGRMRVWRLAYGPGLATPDAGIDRGGRLPAREVPADPNLIDFSPTVSLSRQVGKVTVRGWDSARRRLIEYTAKASDLPSGTGSGKTGPGLAATSLGDREDVVLSAPVLSLQEAKALAVALLRKRSYEFVTAAGRIAGFAELRPGHSLDVYGVGRRFSGLYYVTQVDHALGGSGFTTSFTARKIHEGVG